MRFIKCFECFGGRAVYVKSSEILYISEVLEADLEMMELKAPWTRIVVGVDGNYFYIPMTAEQVLEMLDGKVATEKENGGFLRDETGNRRCWTVPVQAIDLDLMKRTDPLQVWLQVWEQYAKHDLQGFRPTQKDRTALDARNLQHMVKSDVEEILLDLFATAIEWDTMTTTEFMEREPILRNISAHKVGRAIKQLTPTREEASGKKDPKSHKKGRLHILPIRYSQKD